MLLDSLEAQQFQQLLQAGAHHGLRDSSRGSNPSRLLKKSRKLRGSGARAGKAGIAGNVGHIAKRSNVVSSRARASRRVRHTGPVDFVALLAKVTYIGSRKAESEIRLSAIEDCAGRLATDPV
jgi:hypothetical protein